MADVGGGQTLGTPGPINGKLITDHPVVEMHSIRFVVHSRRCSRQAHNVLCCFLAEQWDLHPANTKATCFCNWKKSKPHSITLMWKGIKIICQWADKEFYWRPLKCKFSVSGTLINVDDYLPISALHIYAAGIVSLWFFLFFFIGTPCRAAGTSTGGHRLWNGWCSIFLKGLSDIKTLLFTNYLMPKWFDETCGKVKK